MTGLDGYDIVGMHHGPPLVTHTANACDGQSCCVHQPSAHHMVSWPLIWNAAYRRMDRRCPHRLDHPDPDDVAHNRRVYGHHFHPGQHDCDGCCGIPPERTHTLAARRHVCDHCGAVTHHHPAATDPACTGCGRTL